MKTRSSPSSSRRLPLNLWVLSAASYLTDVSSEMLNNILPLFLSNILGVETATIGLIDGIAEATASLTKLFSGTLSDRLGRRKGLTVGGYLISTIAKPFLYFATSWFWVLGVRFADRLGKGIRTAPRDALLAASVKAEQRGLAFGLHRAADTAGAFTGLALAVLILWRSQAGEAALTRPAFQQMVLASILPAALAVVILWAGLREAAQPAQTIQETEKTRAPRQKLGRTYAYFLAVIVIFTLGNSTDAFIILRGQERGLSVMQIMGMLLSFNAVYALLASPLGSLSDRLGRRRVLLLGWLVYALVYLGLALSRTGWQVWMLFSLYGIYYALTEGTARALVADLVRPEQRGSAYGLYHTVIGLSALPASLIAGILWQGLGSWEGLGASAPFVFGAGMAALASLLFLIGPPGR